MTEHAPDRLWSGIDIPKTAAGVLAALSAAIIGSFLGVAGTLIGAAVASLIGSVGTEVYHRSIDRGRKKLKGTFLTAPAAVGTPPVAAASAESLSPSSPPAPAAPSSSSSSSSSSFSSSFSSGPRQKIRWRRVALVAGALFVLAMGALTVAEVLSGRSIADATRGGSGDGTTVTSLFRGDKSGTPSTEQSDETPEPASSTPADDDGGPATTAPTGEATTQPTEQPTTEPTAPATEAPRATDAPVPDDQGAGAGGADTQKPDNGTE